MGAKPLNFNLDEQLNWLGSIDITSLDTPTIIRASRIAKEIRKKSGIVVTLSKGNLFKNLGQEVLKLDDNELNKKFSTFVLDFLAKNNV